LKSFNEESPRELTGLRLPRALLLSALLFTLAAVTPTRAQTRDYLSASEVAAIGAPSVALTGAGIWARHSLSGRGPNWTEPPGIDRWVANALGRDLDETGFSFMHSDAASFISVTLTGAAILALDLGFPQQDKSRDVLQDQFLYISGALANSGVTNLLKGTVRRQRPMRTLHAAAADRVYSGPSPRDNESFISGHASGAFFAMTFLNKRARSAMRQELSQDDYNSWSWLSPTVTYAWATFVGMSRIRDWEHYFTDVAAGALVGWLIAELFYQFGDDLNDPNGSVGTASMFRLSISF
jgi:membrane-associated phospholipid phosphatase